jgi:hypothetical protein
VSERNPLGVNALRTALKGPWRRIDVVQCIATAVDDSADYASTHRHRGVAVSAEDRVSARDHSVESPLGLHGPHAANRHADHRVGVTKRRRHTTRWGSMQTPKQNVFTHCSITISSALSAARISDSRSLGGR